MCNVPNFKVTEKSSFQSGEKFKLKKRIPPSFAEIAGLFSEVVAVI